MKLYSRNDKDCPIQYSMYNPKICQKGIIDVAKRYQAYAKVDYQLEKPYQSEWYCMISLMNGYTVLVSHIRIIILHMYLLKYLKRYQSHVIPKNLY